MSWRAAKVIWFSECLCLRRKTAALCTPPVSLLKPLHGAEPGLREYLEGFFLQDYPEYEILFCARSESDLDQPRLFLTEWFHHFPQVLGLHTNVAFGDETKRGSQDKYQVDRGSQDSQKPQKKKNLCQRQAQEPSVAAHMNNGGVTRKANNELNFVHGATTRINLRPPG
jgi:hypothetical protein